MKTVKVTLRGKSALLMHAFPMEPIEGLDKKPAEEQAELALYRLPDGQLYVPGVNLSRTLIASGAFSKGKGRGSLSQVVAGTVFVRPDVLILRPQTWRVDSRPVVIPATRGRVMRHRPRFDSWEFDCEIDYDETLLTENQLRKIVDDGGDRVGLCDFRPAKKGPFGRFMVTAWK